MTICYWKSKRNIS